ncbi:chemotaxis protein CheA [Pontixanthobacter aestiaquae]|uniref:Chemotaxis protein CheA n=1 Tax=Pontixanthobacter aestiaquae TaxID=1509367 RepID=A0A844Z273_9SPHN|nr:chemotaxis protein CheA [Pontixanthobacter aestiaquae]MDN3646207.1 chemotaxis protein CheA [Pontixanthobacter aestiaquae]MXO82801.1 chemotaxis protein CheA [Pontixanthobacter aestiaquae]
MDDLLAEFVAETREMLEAIEGELVAWEAEPSDRARLDNIFRFVHTVKGNCGFFDFPRLEKLSHAAEGVLAEVRAGRRHADSRLVSAVLAIIDRITQMTTAIEAGEELPVGSDEFLIAALEGDASDVGETLAMHSAREDAETKTTDAGPQAPRSIRLPVALLDRVMSGVSDMVLARNDLARRLRDAGNEPTLDGPFERLSGILSDVREAITKMRMQRIEHLYNAIPRLVRDLSTELDKQVMVDFEGGDVELDREMIEMIRDPVTHLIRNAIDHGIEKPSERLRAGKREIGMLAIAARQSGNRITIVISDDGAGLNTDKIGEKAVSSGLVSQKELDAMPPESVTDLIFEAGLSTAEEVSAISGRGVGMDVVRANIEKIGGTITVSSNPGEGTMFFLQIPLTLSIISALTVSVDGQRFAIPQSYVEEIAHGASASVEFSRVGDTDLVTFRDRRLPCLTLNNVLGVKPRGAGWDQRLVLLRLGSGDLFALAVDKIHDQEDLVIKPLAPAVMQSGLYAGTTLLDDGSPVLMLDIPTVASENGLVSDVRARPAQVTVSEKAVVEERGRTLMTFVGLDGKRRAIGMQLVARIDQVPHDAFAIDDGRAQVVVDGKIMTLVGVGNDTEQVEIPAGNVKLLRLSDSECELAYAVAELGESVIITQDLASPEGDTRLEGVALIDGELIPVVDGYRLFAKHGSIATPVEKLVCRLPEGDDWVDRMLQPLVAAAGYRVASDPDQTADVTIVLTDTADAVDTVDTVANGRVIKLYSDPNAPIGKDDSIYRYDRTALESALRKARIGDRS